jgi:hypothetical protein
MPQHDCTDRPQPRTCADDASPSAATPSTQIEARLRKLERENRWMRWAYVLLLGVLLGSCTRKPPIPPEIVAREFKVMDDEGNVYASLGIAPWNEEGNLVLRDRKNEHRRASIAPADLSLDGSESSVHLQAGEISLLTMYDRGGWTGAKLSSHPDGRKSALWLTSGTDRPVAPVVLAEQPQQALERDRGDVHQRHDREHDDRPEHVVDLGGQARAIHGVSSNDRWPFRPAPEPAATLGPCEWRECTWRWQRGQRLPHLSCGGLTPACRFRYPPSAHGVVPGMPRSLPLRRRGWRSTAERGCGV